VPKNLPESGQTTYVQPPLAGLFCKVAVKVFFNIGVHLLLSGHDSSFACSNLSPGAMAGATLLVGRSRSRRALAAFGGGEDGGAAMTDGVDGADAEDYVVFGDGEFEAVGGACRGKVGPKGLVGGAPDDLVGGVGGRASGGLPG